MTSLGATRPRRLTFQDLIHSDMNRDTTTSHDSVDPGDQLNDLRILDGLDPRDSTPSGIHGGLELIGVERQLPVIQSNHSTTVLVARSCGGSALHPSCYRASHGFFPF